VVRRGTKETKGTKDHHRAKVSLASLKSLPSLSEPSKFIPPHGGYQNLLSYQKALIIYDATLHFCNRFFTKFDRTREQMIQAARSGKQNILEGSEASATSKETEIKLTNTARASLKELLEDYRDFMRNHDIKEWEPNHRNALRLRNLNRTPGANYEMFRKAIEHSDPAICANAIAGLIKVTCYLLDRQIERLEQDFLKEGGLRERMTRARRAARSKQGPQ
jgi:four helix bundle suffix protein